jgi:hypothetical protein
MTSEEDASFTFVDKRRVSQNGETDSSDALQSGQDAEQTASPEADTASASAFPTELPRLSVRDRLLMCIDILHQGAWISMGLVADPATGQVAKNMADARTAIDCVEFLAEKVQGELDEATRRELKNLLTDLRINFVQQMNR